MVFLFVLSSYRSHTRCFFYSCCSCIYVYVHCEWFSSVAHTTHTHTHTYKQFIANINPVHLTSTIASTQSSRFFFSLSIHIDSGTCLSEEIMLVLSIWFGLYKIFNIINIASENRKTTKQTIFFSFILSFHSYGQSEIISERINCNAI